MCSAIQGTPIVLLLLGEKVGVEFSCVIFSGGAGLGRCLEGHIVANCA